MYEKLWSATAVRTETTAGYKPRASHSSLDSVKDLTVFVNVEPDALVERTGAIFDVPTRSLRIILELTERALLTDPAELLIVVAEARAVGLGVALDDVGQNPDSLTLLSLIAPDVVKLDVSLITGSPTRDQLRVITAVSAYAEATGAVILAEGIESDDHRRRAVDIGASLGQGRLLGPPGPLPTTSWPPPPLADPVPVGNAPFVIPDKPSDLIPHQARVVDKPVLVRYSRYLEHQASTSHEPLTILASFQHAAHFTDDDAHRYAALAAAHPLVAIIATDLPPVPAPGVRGTPITTSHPLADEWTVVILGQHFFAAMIAREVHDDEIDDDDVPIADHRRFAFTLTYDRDTVTAAGRALLRHMRQPTPSNDYPR